MILFVLYLILFVGSQVLGRPRIMNVGHRGDCVHAPQNTMSSFKAALNNGGDGFETDLRLTKDGIIVLRHWDDMTKASNCSGGVGDYTLAEIEQCDAGSWFSPSFAGEKIPLFKQAVEFAKENNLFIVMDLKLEGMGEKIAKIVKDADMEGRVIASCWTETQVADIKKFLNVTVKQRLGHVPEKIDDEYFINWRKQGVHAFSLSATIAEPLPRDFLKLAHYHQMTVFAWTINSVILTNGLDRDGVDGIIGDNVLENQGELEKIHKLLYNDPVSLKIPKYQMNHTAYDPSARTNPLIVGLRGDSKHSPENTMVSFGHAKLSGADGIEIDVRVTKDDSLVVIRDATLDRTTNCTGLVSSKNLEDLQYCDAGSWFKKEFENERIPTFEQVLQFAYENDIIVIVNLLEDNLVQKIAQVVVPFKNMQYRISLVANSPKQVDEIRNYFPIVNKEMKIGSLPPEPVKDTYFDNFLLNEVFTLNFENDKEELTGKFVNEAHKRNLGINNYVGDDSKKMFNAMENGSNTITTTDVKILNDLITTIRKRAWPA